jgi:hypothetical protein
MLVDCVSNTKIIFLPSLRHTNKKESFATFGENETEKITHKFDVILESLF